MKKLVLVGMATTLLGASLSSFAYEQGDMLVRVGITSYDFKKDVKADEQLGVEFAYILTNTIGIGQIGVEASTAMPIDMTLKGTTSKKYADALPLTVVAQYYFDTGAIITPYVGAGLNYTMIDSNSNAIDFDNSMGLVIQAGADFAINDNWGVNFNLKKIEIDQDNGINDISIDPLVVSVSGSYKF